MRAVIVVVSVNSTRTLSHKHDVSSSSLLGWERVSQRERECPPYALINKTPSEQYTAHGYRYNIVRFRSFIRPPTSASTPRTAIILISARVHTFYDIINSNSNNNSNDNIRPVRVFSIIFHGRPSILYIIPIAADSRAHGPGVSCVLYRVSVRRGSGSSPGRPAAAITYRLINRRTKCAHKN